MPSPTFRLVSAPQADAIREIAVSYGVANPDLLVVRAGLEKVVGTTPRRCRLRIGHAPASVPPPAGQRGWPPATVYRTRPPRCRQCGDKLEAGEVVTFGAFPTNQRHHFMGVDSFLHASPCGSPS